MLDVGANLFIGNLDPEVDEKLLYDTFSAFGVIMQTPKVCMAGDSLRLLSSGQSNSSGVAACYNCRWSLVDSSGWTNALLILSNQIMRDPDTGNSKGFGFVNFASFEASDAAIEAMNGQHLCNRPISVTYAFRKDAKGERHGSAAGTAQCSFRHCGGIVIVKGCSMRALVSIGWLRILSQVFFIYIRRLHIAHLNPDGPAGASIPVFDCFFLLHEQ
jgi:RNA recognition motif-containing protein